jgi:hypothetical protein
MAHTVPESEPAELNAGATWTWRRSDLSDYPASTWTLSYYFKNASAAFSITASADGEAHLVDVLPVVTGANAAGRYDWRAYVTDGTDVHLVDTGVVEVIADFQNATAYDGRSLPRRMLDAVNAILEDRATTDQIDLVSSAIGDRSSTRDVAYLLEYRSKLEAEVKRVEGTGGLKNINVRFNNVAL